MEKTCDVYKYDVLHSFHYLPCGIVLKQYCLLWTQLHKPMSQAYLYSKATWGQAHTPTLFAQRGARVCFLQSRESVSVSLSFLPVSSSRLQLPHHCFCQTVCYMGLCLYYMYTDTKMYIVNVFYFNSIQYILCNVCVFVNRTENRHTSTQYTCTVHKHPALYNKTINPLTYYITL